MRHVRGRRRLEDGGGFCEVNIIEGIWSLLRSWSAASPERLDDDPGRQQRPVLLNLGEPGAFDITPWAARVRLIEARYTGVWELPVLGAVSAPTAVLIRPDGHVAWASDGTDQGLRDALATWFGPPNHG